MESLVSEVSQVLTAHGGGATAYGRCCPRRWWRQALLGRGHRPGSGALGSGRV